MHQFEEHHVEFEGFSEYFSKNMATRLELAEQARIDAVKRVLFWSVIILSVGLIIGIGLMDVTGDIFLVFFMLFVSAIFVAVVGETIMSAVKLETKTHLVSHICKFLGWKFSPDFYIPTVDLKRLYENKMITTRYHRYAYEDTIQAHVHGANIDMAELTLERRSENKGTTTWVKVFHGQIITIDFNREFSGRTVVLRDKKVFNAKRTGGMKRVGLVDPVFEKIFEAYSTDQVEARYLLTPIFMQRLVDLETCVCGKNIRFGFFDRKLTIIVETKNRFEAGSMFTTLLTPNKTQKILDEFGAVFDVIDGVLKPDNYRPVI